MYCNIFYFFSALINSMTFNGTLILVYSSCHFSFISSPVIVSMYRLLYAKAVIRCEASSLRVVPSLLLCHLYASIDLFSFIILSSSRIQVKQNLQQGIKSYLSSLWIRDLLYYFNFKTAIMKWFLKSARIWMEFGVEASEPNERWNVLVITSWQGRKSHTHTWRTRSVFLLRSFRVKWSDTSSLPVSCLSATPNRFSVCFSSFSAEEIGKCQFVNPPPHISPVFLASLQVLLGFMINTMCDWASFFF